MRLFNALGNLLSSEKKNGTPKQKQDEAKVVVPKQEDYKDAAQQDSAIVNTERNATTASKILNALEIRDKIKKSTLIFLDSLYLSDPDICLTKNLIIWINTDTTTFQSFPGIEQELTNYWETERGYIFQQIELRLGKPEEGERQVDAGLESMDIYLQEVAMDAVPVEHINNRATISLYGRNGSLLKDCYELSSEELQRQHRKYYNIGRGEFPDVEGGGYRQNHIAIDDVNNQEKNQYVSRTHARIGFSKKIGFFLQVEWGGSQLSGNRTQIYRGEEKIEVENVDVKVPLQSGDIIVLGKSVYLQFTEIN